RPSFTEEPGSAASRSTRIWSPGATRYCLPPLTMTADSELSGLGTARDCTKPPGDTPRKRGRRLQVPPHKEGRRLQVPPRSWGGQGRGRVSDSYRINTEVTSTITITRPAKGAT